MSIAADALLFFRLRKHRASSLKLVFANFGIALILRNLVLFV